MWKDMEGLPETLKSRAGQEGKLGDPILFWTLFLVIAVNVTVVAVVIANARRTGKR
jgi:hypothetical protein